MKSLRKIVIGIIALVSLLCFTGSLVTYASDTSTADSSKINDLMLRGTGGPMLRLYNPNSGEHFYTASSYERDVLVNLGWHSEGTGWVSYTNLGDAVYRLYNPNAGDHHYTQSRHERDYLIKVGWRDEGVSWYSGGDVPVYRLYNPNAKKAGAHHYTTSSHERDSLIKVGWRDEGIGWYAVK